jgi:peptidoglycan/LPS O-acetylase OafA/YrhL
MVDKRTTGLTGNISQNNFGRQRIYGLDALRTLAIVGVTLFHMFPETVKGGYLGVSLFFVLTGYLLAYTSERQRMAGRFRVGQYYLKRIRRIYPSLVVVILVTIGIYHFLAPKVMSAVRPEVISVLLGYNNWWQIAQNADYFTRLANTSPFTHLWFMGIELQYYVLWPLFFLLYLKLVKERGRIQGIGALALLGALTALLMPVLYHPGQDVTRLYYGTDTRIYALLFGAAMGLYRAHWPQTVSINIAAGSLDLEIHTLPYAGFLSQAAVRRMAWAVYAILIGVTLYAYGTMEGQSSFTYQGGMFLMTVVFCIMLALTADSRFTIGKSLNRPVLTWIGKRSYGIFLWQYPVIFLFRRLGWNKLPLYFVLELLVIVLLTIWSDTLSDCLTKRRLPFRLSRPVLMPGILFLVFTWAGLTLMGYGCSDIAASSGHKAVDTQLQARLEENAAALAQQGQEVDASAKAAEKNKEAETAAKETTAKPAEPAKPVNLDGAVCIGDSVMLGAAKDLQQVLPNCYINAEVSRYVGGGIPVAKELEEQGKLGNLVVLALGTNGPIAGQERYEEQTKQLLELLGPTRHIFWVNVYGPDLEWQDTNNNYIAKLAAEHSNVAVIDWYSLVAPHPDWLADDGIHPNGQGTGQYAKLVHDRMVQVLSEQESAKS